MKFNACGQTAQSDRTTGFYRRVAMSVGECNPRMVIYRAVTAVAGHPPRVFEAPAELQE